MDLVQLAAFLVFKIMMRLVAEKVQGTHLVQLLRIVILGTM
jgi:hypothetical protein